MELLGVDGAGVMAVVTERQGSEWIRFVHASGQRLAPLESLHEASQTGPCRDAVVSMAPVVCLMPARFDRWPVFAAAAVAAGVQGMVAAPLVARGRCWGVLNLYWFHQPTLDETDLPDIELLATVAASYLVIADDRREAGIARAQLSARLLHDGLTGLANRELIYELIHHALANVDRRRRPVALLFIDLDAFKAANDTRGHRAGDMVLQEVALRLKSAVRAGDTVSRLGGDEFLVLCDEVSDAAAADGLAQLCSRIEQVVSGPITVDAAPPITIGASIGVAVTTTAGSVADFVHAADQAMYRAKRRPTVPTQAGEQHLPQGFHHGQPQPVGRYTAGHTETATTGFRR